MPFIHPLIFWTGLAAVSLPIIIHILNRRRFKIVNWAAMKFLLDSIRKNRRRLRLEELILMVLRCLAVLLLALAIARFTGCSGVRQLIPAGVTSNAIVFILDDSYSMGQRFGAGTLFSTAKDNLIAELKKLQGSDEVAILLTSRPNPDEALLPRTFVSKEQMESLAMKLGEIKLSDRRTELAPALAGAAKTFEGITSTTKRLIVFGDFRRADLEGEETAAAIRKQVKSLTDAGVKLTIIDYGREAKSNLTVESFKMLDKFAAAKIPVRLGLNVRNNGTDRADNVEVAVKARVRNMGRLIEVSLPTQRIDTIAPGETKPLELQMLPAEAGAGTVSVQLPADELAGDNAGFLAMNVRQGLRVLVIDGQRNWSDPTQSESFFFRRAIDPKHNGRYGCMPEVVTPDSAGDVNFADYDVVVLTSLAEFPSAADANGVVGYPRLTALEKFVRDGGGLAIFTGENPNLNFYNGSLYDFGKGLSPYKIGLPAVTPGEVGKDANQFYQIDPKSIAGEQFLRVFSGENAGLVELVRFFDFTQTEPPQAMPASADVKPPRVLARFTDQAHSPAIASRQYGKGTVVMFYSTASKRWNDWPTELEIGSYVAVMLDMMSYLAKPQEAVFTGVVGEPISFELKGELRDATASLKVPSYPDVDVISLQPDEQKKQSGQMVLNYERVSEAGLYSLGLKTPDEKIHEMFFARNVDPVEGDLRPGGYDKIVSAFGTDQFTYLSRGGPESAAAQTAPQAEYWMWAAIAALAVLALETFLAQRFGHYTA